MRFNVAIPPRLEPADLDWEKSRPVVPWPVNILDFGSFDHPSGSARFHIRVQQGWDVAAIPPEVLADDGGGARWQVHSICLLKAYVPVAVEFKPITGEIKGAKSQGIAEAIGRLWPDGLPTGLAAKERNQAIIKELGKLGYSIPKDAAKAIQRVLKTRHAK
jgi:hypothetical protein